MDAIARFLFSIVMILLLISGSESACRLIHQPDFETVAFQTVVAIQTAEHNQPADTGHVTTNDGDHCAQYKIWVASPNLASAGAFVAITYAEALTTLSGRAPNSIYRPPIASA